jgi:hypothetical protein
MNEQEIHEELMRGIAEQQKEVLEKSTQAMYIYLDDNHVVFNRKFASLLGYASVNELDFARGDFISTFVAEKSRNALVEAYQKAMVSMAASSVDVVLKKKSGAEVKTSFILVPLMFDNHAFAMHFIS